MPKRVRRDLGKLGSFLAKIQQNGRIKGLQLHHTLFF